MFRIGEVAERTKLGVETIRYYEKIGAIAPPSRSENGYRAYTGDAVKRLSFIRRARELGFSLKDIRSLLTFADGPRPDGAMVKEIAGRHLDEVCQKIADLERMAKALRALTSECPGRVDAPCPILDALLGQTRWPPLALGL